MTVAPVFDCPERPAADSPVGEKGIGDAGKPFGKGVTAESRQCSETNVQYIVVSAVFDSRSRGRRVRQCELRFRFC